MQGVRRGNFLIAQPRNPFAWSNYDPLTRTGVITIESGLGTLVPDAITPYSSASFGPMLAALASAAPASATWFTANAALYVPFNVTAPVTVYRMFVHNGSAVSGNLDIGVYDGDFNLLVSTGSTAQAGTNSLQLVDVTDTDLDAGRHYLALVFDNTTATVFRTTWPTNTNGHFSGARYSTSSFALPSAATLQAVSNTLPNNIPLFGAIISSMFS